jgi:hypothetical protein
LGFGGAFTQATAIAINKMKPALQDEIMNAYFGADGIGYTIGRLHMYASISSFLLLPRPLVLTHYPFLSIA